MFKTVITAVDPSHAERAEDLLKTAHEVSAEGAKIYVVSVIEPVPIYVEAQMPTGSIDRAKAKVEDALAPYLQGEAEAIVEGGHAPSRLLGIAEEKGADLIIVASHKPGIEDYFLGSTAGRIVRHAKCAVLVLR